MRGDDAVMEASIEKSHYCITICLEITLESVLTEPYRNYEISLYDGCFISVTKIFRNW